jgi:K+-sensing histidine kinase KdpD
VSLEKMDYKSLLIRFRMLAPMQQTSVVGLIFAVINFFYYFLFAQADPVESLTISIYTSLIFMAIYYFTTVLVMKKSKQIEAQSKGPKKGRRNK